MGGGALRPHQASSLPPTPSWNSVPEDLAPTLPGQTPILAYSDVPEGKHSHHHGGRSPALAAEAAEHEASACILGEGGPQDLKQPVKILCGETKL